jgi:hypothetical protein
VNFFRSRTPSRLALVIASVVAACGKDSVSPTPSSPARLEAVSAVTQSAAVGSSIPNSLVVRVSDASGRPVPNVAVALAVTSGNGSTNPRVALTDAKGEATATWTLGTIIGPNQVTASVMGVETQIKFNATGTPGPVTTISLSPVNPRLLANVDSTKLTALALDAFGNTTTPAPTFTVRDPSLISVDANGMVRVLRRGAGTYVVATAGGKSDSVLVTVLAAGQSICTAVAAPVDLAVGQVVTDVSGQGFCVHASAANAEYAIVPFYASSIPSASIQVEVRGQGLTALPLTTAAAASIFSAPPSRQRQQREAPLVRDENFELRLRDSERRGSALRRGLRGTFPRASRSLSAASAAIPSVGEIVKYNVDNDDFCDNPDIRTGRVMAISDKAIVVGDTANPPGGFTSEEFRSIGVTFDTLVDPVDRAAFGAPSDIDGNGHVIIFFTRAVNELSAAGSGGVVLGYFYRRDLYAKTTESCPGSNEAEILYLLVPDTAGVVNGNKRTKSQVVTAAMGTVAHEYQHLINASRRKFVTKTTVFEERWLDEGLSHMAEDLNFWRAAGRSERSNLDADLYNDPKAAAAFASFSNNNFLRYRTYIAKTETQSPIGFQPDDDDLQTRGAIWNFLRFVGDHQPAAQENAFWTKLVNSTTAGVANLTNALGVAPTAQLRDWAISVFMDDNAPNVDPRFQLTSWNLRSAITNGGTSLAYPLATRLLADNAQNQVLLAGNGVSFLRFSVANNQEALLTVTSGGQALPATVQLAVVRIK